MGKAGRNEMKRVAANFLNGVAVALVMTGSLEPLLAGDHRKWVFELAILASAAMHCLAARIAGGLED